MKFDRAICVAVDRSAAVALVQFSSPDGTTIPEVVPVPYSGEPPWPMSYVNLKEVASGSYLCEGAIGDRRLRLHDDFDQLSIASPAAIAQTAWEITGNTVLLTAQPAGYGTARLSTDGTINHHLGLRKDPVNFGTRTGRWLEALVTIGTGSNRNFKVGFVDNSASLWSTTNELVAISQSGTQGGAIQLLGKAGGSPVTADTGFVPTAGTAFYLQLFVAGSDFAGLWIAGAGNVDDDFSISQPVFIESGIPAGSVGPGLSVQQLSTPAVTLDVDFIDVYSVYPYATPGDIAA